MFVSFSPAKLLCSSPSQRPTSKEKKTRLIISLLFLFSALLFLFLLFFFSVALVIQMKLSGQLFKLYLLTLIFFSLLFNEITTAFRSLARTIGLGRTPAPAPTSSTLFTAMINELLPVVRFGERQEASPAECAVCICKFKGDEEVRELQCLHVFHRDCLDAWLEHQGYTCPLCRSPMLSEAAMMERWRRELAMRGDDLMAPWLLSFHGSHLHWPLWAL